MNDSNRDAGRQMNFFGIDYPELVKQQERPQEPEKREGKTEHDNAGNDTDSDAAR